MMIYQTKMTEIGAIKTKTEVSVESANTVSCSRVIDSYLWTITVSREEPVTISQIGKICGLSDEIFIALADNQREN